MFHENVFFSVGDLPLFPITRACSYYLSIRPCPYYRLQGHALISDSPFQFEKFQNLKFSVIRTCPYMRGNKVYDINIEVQ